MLFSGLEFGGVLLYCSWGVGCGSSVLDDVFLLSCPWACFSGPRTSNLTGQGFLGAVVMLSWITREKSWPTCEGEKLQHVGNPAGTGEWGQPWSFQAVMCPCVMLTFFCCICCISGCVLSWKLLAHLIGMSLNVRRGMLESSSVMVLLFSSVLHPRFISHIW